jgi:hypothetical protein
LGAGLLGGALAGVYVMNAREAVARAQLRAAESREAAAKDAARQAQSEEKLATANANALKAQAVAEEENRKAKEAESVTMRAEAEKAKADSAAAAATKAAREAEAAAAADTRAAEKAKAETAKAEAERAKAKAQAEAAKAQAEADKLAREKLVADKIIAEARLWELKAIDLATLEKELNDYKRELDERELALRPEKTIKDLASFGSDEPEEKDDTPLLPENDPGLTRGVRRLAKASRESRENIEALCQKAREVTLGKVRRLYDEAVRDNRLMDVEYYRSVLKSLYPDWDDAPPEEAEAADAGEDAKEEEET